jgi:hypothetical protein
VRVNLNACTPYPHLADEQDLIESSYNGTAHTLKVHELKTMITQTLPNHKRHHALIQASMYLLFLKRMLDKGKKFDFRSYFEARGLDPTLSFKPEFSAKFAKLLSGLYPITRPPKNLRKLGARWASYVESLPPINFDPSIYIISAKLGRVSESLGYGTRTTIKVQALPHDEDMALMEAKIAMSLLDGHKEPSGVPGPLQHLCLQCPFSQRCHWRPDLHLSSGAKLDSHLSRHVATITKADFSTDEITFLFNDIITPSLKPNPAIEPTSRMSKRTDTQQSQR